ncbi:MAG TPA: hypothetical protein VM759_00185 [Longimicrobium sp.]|nr:hypothetical protein [Longimicrobium sp.]
MRPPTIPIHRFLVLALLSLAGCSAAGGREAAERAVQRHHELYDARRFDVMYQITDPDFKRATTDAQLAALGESLHRMLGPTSSTRLTNVHLGVTLLGGTTVALVYQTEFQHGPGTETFEFRIRGSRAQLVRWNVNSPVFLEALNQKQESSAAGESSTDSTSGARDSTRWWSALPRVQHGP